MNSDLLDKVYTPSVIEKKWYAFWENEKLFATKKQNISKKKYSIVMPPPNITGILHMGHALNSTLQDILCRYRRLKGDNVLWIPGTDHAGIATQNVVEKKIESDGNSRHKIGRTKFIKAVWKWKNIYGGNITEQIKRLGASCNWDHERFTMDDGLSFAVRKVFVQLYNDNLIYKGNYITNWCPRCSTALSDLEVEHDEVKGYLYKIRYHYVDCPGSIVVATTRPETILGDTAIAVNPDDSRYHELKSKSVLLPIINKQIPIIKDKYVDMSFGTGALKVTPAHDPNDFDIAQRHNLSSIKIIDSNGKMNSNSYQFVGLDRYKCRNEIINILKKQGFLVSIEPYTHSIGHCYRCKTVVEPNLSEQWFVKTTLMAKKAIEAVKIGKTRIIPSSWTKTYYDWMLNIKDWCISRQIWWGHQIPAWTCNECGKLIVNTYDPDSCFQCGSKNIVQDPDVLDTWFSSSLWPFSTMGWPNDNTLFEDYYPTSVLITGFDILFFWVARMMMMGLYFTNKVPFHDVYVHALVRDEQGKKMSKSKGNVIDPINVINKYGADAFRFTLASFAAQGRDIRMCEKRVDGYRNFINKLWNAARFSLIHLKKEYENINANQITTVDLWILIKLELVTKNVSDSLKKYNFNEAVNYLYKFVWHEFCDWYLEAIKPTLYGNFGEVKKEVTCSVLWCALKNILILLHPFLPFVTEEIWHKLPEINHSIMQAKYPEPNKYTDCISSNYSIENDMDMIIDLVTNIRNVRGEMNIAQSIPLEVIFQPDSNKTANIIINNKDLIVTLARLSKVIVDFSKRKPEFAATIFVRNSNAFVLLEKVVDFCNEKLRLEKEMGKLSKELNSLKLKLSNNNFLNKAPANIVNGVKKKYELLINKQEKMKTIFEKIQKNK